MSAPRSYDVNAPLELLADPVAQWLDWEEQANLVGFRVSTQPIEIDVVAAPREQVEVHLLGGAPPAIVDRFLRKKSVLLPRHPLNRDPSVAWSGAPVAERWTARFTASRTLAMPGPESGAALFSVKLATDHPHPDFHQPEKTKLREEALDAIRWSQALDRIDRALPPLAAAQLVREVLVILARGGETGCLVRDLRAFQDGHHYLPALSVPFVGRQIAAAHGASFDAFWAEAFAAAAGRAKAELFARYGLWYETPNPQNVLVQLDAALAPTGRIVFRDVGDGDCATDAFECAELPWTRLQEELRPETKTSFWAFGEAADHSVPAETLDTWYRAHDDAYFAELARWFPQLSPAASAPPEDRLEHWSVALRSDAGCEAVTARFTQLSGGAGPAPG